MIGKFIMNLFPISIWFNGKFLEGRPHETVSAHAWIEGWERTERVLNFIYWPIESDHCKKCHDRYMIRRFG